MLSRRQATTPGREAKAEAGNRESIALEDRLGAFGVGEMPGDAGFATSALQSG